MICLNRWGGGLFPVCFRASPAFFPAVHAFPDRCTGELKIPGIGVDCARLPASALQTPEEGQRADTKIHRVDVDSFRFAGIGMQKRENREGNPACRRAVCGYENCRGTGKNSPQAGRDV